jgi:NhaP-type Na+/H+ or K+/H+ antiporter
MVLLFLTLFVVFITICMSIWSAKREMKNLEELIEKSKKERALIDSGHVAMRIGLLPKQRLFIPGKLKVIIYDDGVEITMMENI